MKAGGIRLFARMDSMTLFRCLIGAPVAAATIFVGGLALREILQNLALLRTAERVPARMHARRAADDLTATVVDGEGEKEIPVRAAFHWTLNLLDEVTLLKPKEGLPVVGTPFQLWVRPAACVFFALLWTGAAAWLLRSSGTPPPLPADPLFDLRAEPGYWKAPAFWSFLPLLLLGPALFGKNIFLPTRLLMLTGGLGLVLLFVGMLADQATLRLAAWPGAVQRQSIVSWQKAELKQVKQLVEFKTVHYKWSSTLKKWTRDTGMRSSTTLQLRDASGAILVEVDERLEPVDRRLALMEWLIQTTGLPLEFEETSPP